MTMTIAKHVNRILQYIIFPDSDIDECSSSPCQNGGQCQDEVNKYTCTCDPGYEGSDCKTGGQNILLQLQTAF